MIEINGKLKPQDFVSAQYLHIRPRLGFKILGAVILLAIVWAIWYSFFGTSLKNAGWKDFLFLASLVYLLFYFYFLIPWQARRRFRQQKSLHREVKMRFAESGVNAVNETGRVTIPWSDYLRWKENDHIVLLYVSDTNFHMIPKSFFQDVTETRRFLDLLEVKIGRRAA